MEPAIVHQTNSHLRATYVVADAFKASHVWCGRYRRLRVLLARPPHRKSLKPPGVPVAAFSNTGASFVLTLLESNTATSVMPFLIYNLVVGRVSRGALSNAVSVAFAVRFAFSLLVDTLTKTVKFIPFEVSIG